MGFTCNRTKHKEKSSLKRLFSPSNARNDKTKYIHQKSPHSKPLVQKEKRPHHLVNDTASFFIEQNSLLPFVIFLRALCGKIF